MRNKIKGKSPVVLILNIVILVLCVCCLLAVVGIIADFAEAGSYRVSEDSFIYRLQDEEYTEVWRLGLEDTARNEKKQDYYRIGEYVEAAFLQRAFEKTGESELARRYRERMENAAADIGEFGSVLGKIDAKLAEY